mmetsp:Transcript_11479/g.33042  ORF Transcript_11479/g.33042 Transcript_11479/m.33042 type:complete len:996 (+) Transcript_11479:115-3102(+)
MRSPSISANQHGGSGQKHVLQRQPEIQDELQKLEAAIGNLLLLQQPVKQPVKNDSKRPSGFKKFLGRRKNKKDAPTEECVLERIKNLKQVCKDLKSDEKKKLKGRNSEVEKSMPEARDVKDSLPTNGRGVTSKEDALARQEAIVACREILSIMSSKASIDNFTSVEEAEIEQLEEDTDLEECASEATEDYFCGLPRIWCFAYDEDEVGTEDETGTAEEVPTDPVTDPLVRESEDQATSTEDDPVTPTEALSDHFVAEVTEDVETSEGDQDQYQDQDQYLLSDTETEDGIERAACVCNFFESLNSLTESETSEVHENEDINQDQTNENPDGDVTVAATPAIEEKSDEEENGHQEIENCLQQRDAIVAITSCCELGAESKKDDQGRQAVKSEDEQEEMVGAVPVNEEGSEDEDHDEANYNLVDDATENIPLGCNAFNCRHEDEAEEEYDDEDEEEDFVNEILSVESTGENDSTGFLAEEEELETHEMKTYAQNERVMKVEVPELQSALTLENLPKIEVVGYKNSSNLKKGLAKKRHKTKNVVKDKLIETKQMKNIAKRTQESNPSNSSKSDEFKVSKKSVSTHRQFERKQRTKKRQDKNVSKMITKPKETFEEGTVAEPTSKTSNKLHDKKQKASSAETSEPEIHPQKDVPKKKKTQKKLMRLLMRKLSSKNSELFDVVKSDEKYLCEPPSILLERQPTEDVTPSNSEPESVSPSSEAPNSGYTLGSTYTPKTEQLVCNSYDMPECPITPINLHNSSLSSWTGSSPNAEEDDSTEEDKNDETTTEEDISEETEEDLSEEEKRRKLNLFMNFLQALKSKQKNGEEDIVECLSPVLSMGGESCDTGSCNAYDDDEYINHYYDFGEDDCDSEDYSDDDDLWDDDHYEQHDDDSFIMSIKALSKDEATMSYLKMALDIAEENNLDLNYSQITDPMIEARDEVARSNRAADDRRVTSPKAKKKSKPRPKSQKGRQRKKDGLVRPANPARMNTDRQDASLVSF